LLLHLSAIAGWLDIAGCLTDGRSHQRGPHDGLNFVTHVFLRPGPPLHGIMEVIWVALHGIMELIWHSDSGPPRAPQDPNVDDPLNKEAAQRLQQDPQRFERLVRNSITRGERIDGHHFPPCMA
jgi:hypothetical protein